MSKEYPYDCYQKDGTLIDPGKGYRLLKTGEAIKEGDEYLSFPTMKWVPDNFDVADPCNSPVRRKLETGVLEEYTSKEYPGFTQDIKDQYKFVVYENSGCFMKGTEDLKTEGWHIIHSSQYLNSIAVLYQRTVK